MIRQGSAFVTDPGAASPWLYCREPELEWCASGLAMAVAPLDCWQLDARAQQALHKAIAADAGRVIELDAQRHLLPLGRGKALLVCPRSQGTATRPPLPATGVAVNCSGQYSTARLRGGLARSLLETGCSLDFRDQGFPPGRAWRSLFHDVPVLAWRRAEDEYLVLAERSLAEHFFQRLLIAAREFSPA